jgi:hypothetical protein
LLTGSTDEKSLRASVEVLTTHSQRRLSCTVTLV